MFAWIAANYPTILICLALALIVTSIIISLARNKKKGKSSCGCGCQSCPMGGSCTSTDPYEGDASAACVSL